MVVEQRFLVVDAVFTVRRRVRVEGWSGTVAGKIVYDALSLGGVVLERGGLFRVSPLRPAGGSEAVGGFLAPGERYWFRVVFWGSPGVIPGDHLARAFMNSVHLLDYIDVVEVSLREEVLRVPEPFDPGGSGDGVAVEAVVRHGPTFYRFHGAVVPYPSPWRMIASIGRRLSIASGADYRPLVRALQPCVELAVDNTKRAKIILTHGKRVTVFRGEAVYHIVCPRERVEAIRMLLEASKLTGVGGSPGLGVGEVVSVVFRRPRHELPAAIEPWALEPEE